MRPDRKLIPGRIGCSPAGFFVGRNLSHRPGDGFTQQSVFRLRHPVGRMNFPDGKKPLA